MYRFPRTRFVAENDIKQQIGHVGSEVAEIVEAIQDMEPADRVAEEIADAIHSLETAARIMQEQYGVNMAAVFDAVERKNRLRGYYDHR